MARMSIDTTTTEGRTKRINEIVTGYMESGNSHAIVRIIGGSVAEYDERYDPCMSGGHPDEH